MRPATNKPLVSVLIPTFNRAELVLQAMQSVGAQSLRNFELIVIDDGSIDNTRERVESFFRNFEVPCRYLHQHNQGPAAARNLGLQYAQGEFIAFLDSDDLWLPDKLSLDVGILQKHPNVDVVVSDSIAFLEGRMRCISVHAEREVKFDDWGLSHFRWDLPIFRRGPCCVTSSMMIRQTAIEAMNQPAFDPQLRVNEDWDFELRLFAHRRMLFSNQVLCHYRVFADSTRPYSIRGESPSLAEREFITKNQIKILDRYLNSEGCDENTRALFVDRLDELQQLLSECEAVEH